MRKQLRTSYARSHTKGTFSLWEVPKDNAIRIMRRLNNPQDTEAALFISLLLLLVEAGLCLAIIDRVPYTEIDWDAYVQQVAGFLQGERDYTALKGGTGPLVYPAGFLYIYSLFYKVSSGKVLPAQFLFLFLYLFNLGVVFWLYVQSKALPPWALVLLCLSKRIHSIFVLRLFNDAVAMFIAYCATALLLKSCWVASVIVFSLAVSVKMNVLLMAPPVLLVLLKVTTLQEIGKGAVAGVVLQLLLGLPFLVHNAQSYLSRAFELSRVFQHVWSVNLKFLPEAVFQSQGLATILLGAHLAVLWLFATFRWCRLEGGLGAVVADAWKRSIGTYKNVGHLRTEHILTVIFTGNFIGIVFARSLHFQFYSWYFHMLPLLLWQIQVHPVVRVGLWGAIELIWNIYPTTPISSLYLLACHLGILLGLWFHPKVSKVYERAGMQ